MSQPPEKNAPFSRAADAAEDIGDAVDFILDRTGAERVNLIGWSWGTVTTGLYTSANSDKIDKLVLYAPLYDEENPARVEILADPDDPTRINAGLGAYTPTARTRRARWDSQILPDDKSAWREEEIFETWFQTLLATEPEGAQIVRAPNGAVVDGFEIAKGNPIYDASAIEVPTLVIRGDADPLSTHSDAFGLFEKLGSEDKLTSSSAAPPTG
jgi:pimeloyl-ACP methyl ester carboxylesterase